MGRVAVVVAGEDRPMANEALPFPKGMRVVELYRSKTKGLRACPGVVTEAGPEVSQVKFDNGMIKFVTHKWLRKERPRVRPQRAKIRRHR